MVRHHHSLGKEGAVTGVLGGMAVAVWFLILDLLKARPLHTPSVLGQVILFGNTSPVTDRIVTGGVIGYTLIHLAVFIAMGLFITELVHLAVNSPLFRFGILMLFVVFEVFFYGFTYVFFVATRELFPWWEVLVADTLAVVVMVTYLWRKHPSLKRALAHEALGA
jgi:hypothetical protein